ncbi:MAG: protein-glutamate O-methyltransferase CheR [Polyangiaceae bacterium]
MERFRRYLERRLGWCFDDSRLPHLKAALEARLTLKKTEFATYLALLGNQPDSGEEIAALAEALTIGETYFYRDVAQLSAFAEIALVERRAVRGARLRVLSAACSTGEEAYTLLMAARDHDPLDFGAERVRVVGIDVNSAAIEKARRGRYSSWALRELPKPLKRYFRAVGAEFEVVPELRDAVTFEQRNLVASDSSFWARASWDVIFCRNVLMYLAPEAAETVVRRMVRALEPGGFLFLGHAETLKELPSELRLRRTQSAFFYQRRP